MSVELGLTTFAGCIGGAANCFTGFPFDSVKVRLQTSPRGTFTGPLQCLQHIVSTEGVTALYRGMSVPLLFGALETGINYVTYTQSLPLIEGRASASPSNSSLPSVAAAAAVAGIVLSPVLSPAELVKCRLQASSSLHGRSSVSGPLACVRHLLQQEGIRGLFRGLSGTMARESCGNALFFTAYETLRRLPGRDQPADANDLRQRTGLTGILVESGGVILAGGVSGMCMWAAVLPIDVAKSRMQVAHPGSLYDQPLLRNLIMLYRERGFRGCYPGLAPVMLRSFPANAAQWCVYELIMRSAS